MKKNVKKDMREKSPEELAILIQEAHSALFMLSMEKSQFKLKNTRVLRAKRHEIAVLSTLKKEKEGIHENA